MPQATPSLSNPPQPSPTKKPGQTRNYLKIRTKPGLNGGCQRHEAPWALTRNGSEMGPNSAITCLFFLCTGD